MKKALIAGAASTIALAAMPMAGVFATNNATINGTLTDDVTLTVNSSCTLNVTDTDGADAAGGSANSINLGGITAGAATSSATNGDMMTISCNDATGWVLQATATGLGNPNAETPTYTIPFGAFPASGIGTDGTNSVWSAKIAVDEANASKVQITSGWDSFAGATASSTTILSSKTFGGSGTNANDVQPVSNLQVTPSYKAYASTTQQPGTYVGKMTYNFTTGTGTGA